MSPFTEDSAKRKEYPVYSGFMKYFPDAIQALCKHTHDFEVEDLVDCLLQEDWLSLASLAMRSLEEQRGGVIFFNTISLNLQQFMMVYPRAVADICHLSYLGNEKHNAGEPLHWAREKSSDHADCIARHLMDEDWVELAWRALAQLQIELENGYAPFKTEEGSGSVERITSETNCHSCGHCSGTSGPHTKGICR